MIHFQYAAVALGTVMTSVRLGFETPLTNSYTPILLFLYRNSESRHGLTAVFAFAGETRGLVINKGTFTSNKILVFFMRQLNWKLNIPIYCRIRKSVARALVF